MKGVVSFVNGNPWDDRRTGEKITLYSFKIEGDETWYRTGQEKPPFEKGQSIQFDVGAKNAVKLDSVTILESEVKVSPKTTTTTRAGNTGSISRDEYWSNKEARDIAKDERYQTVDIPRMTFCTSQDAAVALVTACMAHDCLPKLDTVAKTSRLKAVLQFVDEITDRFYKQRMAAKVDESEAEVETEAPASKGKSLDE